MIIEINTELLEDAKITPDMWVFMFLMAKGENDKAWAVSAIDDVQLEYMQHHGYLKIGIVPVPLQKPNIHIREKFMDMIERNEDELVALFCSTYPKSEHRGGVKANLQKDRKRIASKIKSLVGNDKVKATHIINCIKLDLDKRKRNPKGASWLPDLLVYLNQERWRFVEDEVAKGEQPQEDGRITNEL